MNPRRPGLRLWWASIELAPVRRRQCRGNGPPVGHRASLGLTSAQEQVSVRLRALRHIGHLLERAGQVIRVEVAARRSCVRPQERLCHIIHSGGPRKNADHRNTTVLKRALITMNGRNGAVTMTLSNLTGTLAISLLTSTRVEHVAHRSGNI
jgi:hypothetical protein